jgi:hypothetical protein
VEDVRARRRHGRANADGLARVSALAHDRLRESRQRRRLTTEASRARRAVAGWRDEGKVQGQKARTFHDVSPPLPPGGCYREGWVCSGWRVASVSCLKSNHNSISDGGNSIFVSDDHHRRHSKRMGGRGKGGREWREVGEKRRDETQHRVLSNHRTQSFLDASNKTLPI